MKLIGNIIWFVFGGVFMGISWMLIGLLAFVSIIGIPWGRACFNIGLFSFFPFGKEAVSREVVTGTSDVGTGAMGTIGNVIWLLFAGIWLALGHIFSAVFCFVTIIGIPFALQHIKLVSIALMPIGKCIVESK